MGRYWRVFGRITKMSLMRMFLYRVNSWTNMVAAAAYFVAQVLFIEYLLNAGSVGGIGGYSKSELYLVFAFSQVTIMFVFWFVTDNVVDTIRCIYRGQLDFYLIRPMNPVFLTMYQKFSGVQNLTIIGYLLVLFPYLLIKNDYGLDCIGWLQIGYVVFFSILIYSMLYWIAALVNFYWQNFWGLWWFINNTGDITRWPKNVYPYFLQVALTYLIPLFLIENPIYDILRGTFSFDLGLQILLVAVIMLVIIAILWKDGLKRYNSAA
ncbi:ABC transporter permease [Patescibacteria group bacterium]|nr:ABC transporter permease [Patescibacteria group bacterium]